MPIPFFFGGYFGINGPQPTSVALVKVALAGTFLRVELLVGPSTSTRASRLAPSYTYAFQFYGF